MQTSVVPQRELKLFWLAVGNLIASTGSSFMWPMTTIYMHNYLHESLTVAGIVLFLDSLLMIGGSYFGGYIYDHLNPRRWLLTSIGISLLAVTILIFYNGWPAYPIFLLLDAFGIGITNTILNSMATSITRYTSRYVFNITYLMMNLGVVLGTLCVGFIIDISITLIFVINAIMIFVFLIIAIYCYFPVTNHAKKRRNKDPKTTTTSSAAVRVIMGILLVAFCIQLGYSQWSSNLSVYMGTKGINMAKYSLLWTLNGVIIVLSQPVISWVDERFNVNTLYKLFGGTAMFIVAFFSLTFAREYSGFVLSMILVTVAEVYTFPTISAVVDELSGLNEKGKYQANVNVAFSAGRAVGPLFGGVIIDLLTYNTLFISMALLILISGILLVSLVRTNLRKKDHA